MRANKKDEIFDVVNENDEVVGSAPRSQIHAKKLMHRAVHAIFFNGAHDILLQKRSLAKDLFPGIWTTSCSGHVDSGETYENALVRECHEELGVKLKIEDFKYIGKISACPETNFEFTKVYAIINTGPFVFPSEEVASLEWVSVYMFEAEIKVMPRLFTPSFKKVYEFYKNVEKSL